jgi:hypothetical protein
MKSKLIFCVLCFLMFRLVSRAQEPVFKEATLSHPADLWTAVKLVNGINVLNGVSFYIHDGECNSTKIKLLKIVNANNYSINFSYQLTATQPIVNVIVPASFSIEGLCNSSDENILKLVVTPPVTKSEAEKKLMREFLLSHVFVTKL